MQVVLINENAQEVIKTHQSVICNVNYSNIGHVKDMTKDRREVVKIF